MPDPITDAIIARLGTSRVYVFIYLLLFVIHSRSSSSFSTSHYFSSSPRYLYGLEAGTSHKFKGIARARR